MNETNPQLELARHYIQYTGTNVFLTGKAGTGKTTFLRDLVQRAPKRMVVLAPTGVAAINAGGVTIHSFFQLPFNPYIPGMEINPGSKKDERKLRREKIEIIRSLDLLVIDEISMVRADLLDAIDYVLRKYRNRYKPFGGVQLLLIGDVQQLAPVAREEDWELLSHHYASPYFFHSHALMSQYYVTIELTQVYRQSDRHFIDILNAIRENRASEAILRQLNTRYKPNFRPKEADEYITLTTHNSQAHAINRERLDDLPGKTFSYKATIAGIFPGGSYPTDDTLLLKKGAQVMFIKNDTSVERRYFNGKIGIITSLSNESITVRCGREEPITVEPQEWQNMKYTLNDKTKEIEESVEGTFKQYPIKPAWAITIHKSQGLTFDRAIINAGASFSHGQVYVALSRCRTLEGMVLATPIRQEAIVSDATVASFVHYVAGHQPDKEQLDAARRDYFLELVVEQFDYKPLYIALEFLTRLFDEHLDKLFPKQLQLLQIALLEANTHLLQVGDRFRAQLHTLCAASAEPETDATVQERIIKGATYFAERTQTIFEPIIQAKLPEIENKEIAERVDREYERICDAVRTKLRTLAVTADGFTIGAYLTAKSKAAIEGATAKAQKRTAAPKAQKVEVGSDIRHPALYVKLRTWRRAKAEEHNVVIYNIFSQKALLGLSNKMPTTKAELAAIPGIGKVIIQKYGAEILELIDEYRVDNGLKHPSLSMD